MLKRHQLPVASPIPADGLFAGLLAFLTGVKQRDLNLEKYFLDLYKAKAAVLTNSGTNALAEALRIATSDSSATRAGTRPIVAMPAYACADLITAAKKANVAVCLYDTDPNTLSPVISSLESAVANSDRSQHVSAIVVAHLYGMPVDIAAVSEIATRYGIPLIEDCAQNASSRYDGELTGTFGDLTVLSFGRGKGTTAGSGGALLAISNRYSPQVKELETSLPHPDSGLKNLIISAITALIGRPSVYSIPASIPQLGLGETAYKDPVETTRLSISGRILLSYSVKLVERTLRIRTSNAQKIANRGLTGSPDMQSIGTAINPLPRSQPGYLRLPVLLNSTDDIPIQLGVARGYPKPLDEYPEIDSLLLNKDTTALTGARYLAEKLYTIPTHHLLNDQDIKELRSWMNSEIRQIS